MCGRYYVEPDDQYLELYSKAQRLHKLPLDLPKAKDVHPGENALALGLSSKGVFPGFLTWGYPEFQDKLLINTRIETIQEKEIFKTSFEKYRCALVANGFYEWDSKHQKYFITGKDKLFYLAGIFEPKSKGFSIITRDSYGELANIHPRSPIILDQNQAKAYCEKSLDYSALSSLTPEQILQIASNV